VNWKFNECRRGKEREEGESRTFNWCPEEGREEGRKETGEKSKGTRHLNRIW
jgi:hypothetical protein